MLFLCWLLILLSTVGECMYIIVHHLNDSLGSIKVCIMQAYSPEMTMKLWKNFASVMQHLC